MAKRSKEDVLKDLERAEARLNDVQERGDEAISEYDLMMGYDADFYLNRVPLLANHVEYYRKELEQITNQERTKVDITDNEKVFINKKWYKIYAIMKLGNELKYLLVPPVNEIEVDGYKRAYLKGKDVGLWTNQLAIDTYRERGMEGQQLSLF